MKIRVSFDHGLGDCVYFSHILALYTRRGFDFTVAASSDKHIVFQQAGVETTTDNTGATRVPWHNGGWIDENNVKRFWEYNKAAKNISENPLPFIGSPADLWQELCDLKLSLSKFISPADRSFVQNFVRDLPRPLILLHSKGNTSLETKSIPDDVTRDLYKQLLDKTSGTQILLDWDDRVPRLSHWRIRHLKDDWERLTTSQLIALIEAADLMVGVDSGPLHLSRFTNTPAIGYFPDDWHYPTRFSLPRPMQVNVVPREKTHPWNIHARVPYNITECPSQKITVDFFAETCFRMLAEPRYLNTEHKGADVLLQQFILDWQRGSPNALTEHTDRNRSFDILLRELRVRFDKPLIVETGCIRSPEDWPGAGYATYLFAAFIQSAGGELVSVDYSEGNCAFARSTTADFSNVSVHCQDSVSFLKGFNRAIDVLYLDSVDTELPHAADHALNEIQAAEGHLTDRSIVILDDTVYSRGAFIGKGAKAIPWMMSKGWKILYSGYQTICIR